MADDNKLILELLKCDVLKIGNFKLKSGDFSPIYVDLRRIIHYPKVMKDVVAAIRTKQTKENVNADIVCGIPYTAIPIASIFSAFYEIPMVMKRKEAKDYGTKRLIEGDYKSGDTCLLIDDIICSGTSIKNTVEVLRNEGLHIRHCVVVIDKEQGGKANLKNLGINVLSLFNIGSVFNIYCSINRVELELAQKVTSYLKDNPCMPIYENKNFSALSFKERAENSDHPMAKRLLQIMNEKKTNLCVALNTNHSQELINLAEKLGPYICLLSTHIDTLSDFDENVVKKLIAFSSLHNFLILEDRKFTEIGETVISQYKKGIYKIETWADLVTVNDISGGKTIEALKSAVDTDKRACVLVSEMDTADDVFENSESKQKIFQIADNHADFVIGYTLQKKYPQNTNLISLYRDVNRSSSNDSFNEKCKASEEAIAEGADVIIAEIGAIIGADVINQVVEYRNRCFKAYLNRIS